MMLLAVTAVPTMASSQKAIDTSTATGNEKHIKIIENTPTSQIFQVDYLLFTIKANKEHTDATIFYNNMKTGEKSQFNVQVTKSCDKYFTKFNSGGKVSSVTTSYDPLEPGAASAMLMDNSQKIGAQSTIYTMSGETYYWWDGIRMVKGGSVKYPHADRSYYGIQTWRDWVYDGNKLVHCQMNQHDSRSMASLSPVGLGVAIGGLIGLRLGGGYGGVLGSVIGALIGQILTGPACNILMDESNCIWFWYGKQIGFKTFYINIWPPYIIGAFVPLYLRVSTYTLWDDVSAGSP